MYLMEFIGFKAMTNNFFLFMLTAMGGLFFSAFGFVGLLVAPIEVKGFCLILFLGGLTLLKIIADEMTR